MYKVMVRRNNRFRRKIKIRSTLKGTGDKPRLSVFRSNRYIYAQLIDDVKKVTVVGIDALVKDLHKNVTKIEAAKQVGKALARKALEMGIKKAAFDRNGYKFHGRVKSLADAAREEGLKI